MINKFIKNRFYFLIVIFGLISSTLIVNTFNFTVNNQKISSREIYTIKTIPGPNLISPANNTYTTESSVVLSWEYNVNIGFYVYQINDKIDFSGTEWAYDSTVDTTYTVILPDGKYYWHIRGFDKTGQFTYWSTTWCFTIDQIDPLPPTLLTPSNSSTTRDNTTTLTWKADPDDAIYQLQVDTTNSFTNSILDIETTENYTCPELADGVKYWRVRSTDLAENIGNWSDVWNFQIYTYLGTSTLISLPNETITNDNSPELVWSSVANATSYKIQIDDNADFTSPLIQQTVVTSYEFTPPLDDIYYWRVQAQDDYLNTGTWSDVWNFKIDTISPIAPTLVLPNNNSINSELTPFLDWSDITDFIQYRIQVDTASDSSTAFVDSYTTDSFHTIASSLLDDTYYWRVCAKDIVDNWGEWSDIGIFIIDTTSPIITGVITNPTNPMDTESITISANIMDINGIINALLHYRINNGFWINVTMNLVVGETYSKNIGILTCEDFLEYFITANDTSQNPNTVTNNNSGSYYSLTVSSGDFTGPTISNIAHTPMLPSKTDYINITCSVTDANGIQSVKLYFRVNEGEWNSTNIIFLSSSTYKVSIGLFDSGDKIEYYIVATDNSPNANSVTNNNSSQYYSFIIQTPTEKSSIQILIPSLIIFGLLVTIRKKQ